MLAITHYNRLLHELKPDHVHILGQGRIVASGGAELADQLEIDGYAAFAGGATATRRRRHVRARSTTCSRSEPRYRRRG